MGDLDGLPIALDPCGDPHDLDHARGFGDADLHARYPLGVDDLQHMAGVFPHADEDLRIEPRGVQSRRHLDAVGIVDVASERTAEAVGGHRLDLDGGQAILREIGNPIDV